MKMDRKYKPELITCSKADNRPVLENVMIDIHNEATVAVATDGKRVVVVPVEIESIHETGTIPVAAFKEARKVKMKRRPKRKSRWSSHHSSAPPDDGCLQIELNGQARINNGSTHVAVDRPDQDTLYPKWHQVIPDGDVQAICTVNSKYLYELAQAMGDDVVTLKLRNKGADNIFWEAPIEVLPSTRGVPNKAFAILMPCRPS